MRPAVEHHVLVDLVAQEIAVERPQELGEPVEVALRQHRAGRVVRRVHDHEARSLVERGTEPFPVDREGRRRERQMHHAPARERHRRLVGVVARVEHDDLVVAANDGLNRAENRLGSTARHGHLGVRVRRDAVEILRASPRSPRAAAPSPASARTDGTARRSSSARRARSAPRAVGNPGSPATGSPRDASPRAATSP